MDFTLQPSLEHFSTVVIATNLLKSPDIRQLFAQNVDGICHLRYAKQRLSYTAPGYMDKPMIKLFLEKVFAKLGPTPLPQILQRRVSKVLKQIVFEIVESYKKFFDTKDKKDFNKYMDHLQFTPMGCVDFKRTAKQFLEDEDIDTKQRYRLLKRFFCVPWPKSLLRGKPWHLLKRPTRSHSNEESYMRKIIDRQLKEPCGDFCRCMTKLLAVETDDIFFHQFWLSLSSYQRESLVEDISNKYVCWKNCTSEILFYLISQMNTAQQSKFFSINGRGLLSTLLNTWVRREFLVPCVKLIRNIIPTCDFAGFMIDVAEMGCQDLGIKSYFQRLFEEFWIGCSYQMKRELLGWYSKCFVAVFIKLKNVKSIRVMLIDADDSEKMDVIAMLKGYFDSVSQQTHSEEEDNFLKEVSSIASDVITCHPNNDFTLCYWCRMPIGRCNRLH